MAFELEFKESALKEWRNLDESIRKQFKKKLAERLANPRVEADRLRNRLLQNKAFLLSFPRKNV
jgi:mRNA interferase RelE/StbE